MEPGRITDLLARVRAWADAAAADARAGGGLFWSVEEGATVACEWAADAALQQRDSPAAFARLVALFRGVYMQQYTHATAHKEEAATDAAAGWEWVPAWWPAHWRTYEPDDP